jgi:hypothetical protein
MTDSDIITAAFTRLAAIPNAPPIAWPGVDFTPPDSGTWWEAAIFPNEPRNLTLDSDTAEHLGFLQVQVCYRPGVGLLVPVMSAEAVIASFPKGTELGPVRVRQKPWLGPTIADDGYLFLPVTIPWRGIV